MIRLAIIDSNSCRFFNYDKNHSKLLLLNEIKHPELRLKSSETLTTDRPGHYQKNESTRGAYSPHMDAKEIEIDNFSREIARELNNERNHHAYEKLILIVPPHMHGLLNHHLDKHVKDLIINIIHKDLHHYNESELLNFLEEHAAYPDK